MASLQLYEKLGFIREKRLFNFYLNGKDCFRLILEIPKEHWVPIAIDGAAPEEKTFTPSQHDVINNPSTWAYTQHDIL